MSAQLSIPEPEMTALVVPQKSAIATVVGADKDDILGKLAAKIAGFKADVTTNKGREEIASMGRAVSSSKVTLLKLADTLTEEAKRLTKSVAAEKKIIEDRMDTLRDNVLQPLVDYRNIEKERVAAHEAEIDRIVSVANSVGRDGTVSEIREAIALIEGLPARQWQEFAEKASQVTKNALDTLNACLQSAIQRDHQAAELARLQAEEAERARLAAIAAQEARERQIAAEAAERARREAEQAAEQLRVAAEQKAEAERQAGLRREQEAREATERAERQARQAEADRLAAEQRAVEREAALARQAQEQAAEAVAAEQRRAAAAVAQAEIESAKRAANVAHQKRINGEALADLMKLDGMTEALGKAVITAAAKGQVRHVGIAY